MFYFSVAKMKGSIDNYQLFLCSLMGCYVIYAALFPIFLQKSKDESVFISHYWNRIIVRVLRWQGSQLFFLSFEKKAFFSFFKVVQSDIHCHVFFIYEWSAMELYCMWLANCFDPTFSQFTFDFYSVQSCCACLVDQFLSQCSWMHTFWKIQQTFDPRITTICPQIQLQNSNFSCCSRPAWFYLHFQTKQW